MEEKKIIKALVVDDEQVIRDFFVRFLSLENIDVKCADGGLQAVEAARREKFDVAFIDMKMPDMNGLETFRELKKINPAIKCAMITGYAVDALLQEAMKEGAVASMQKPLDISQIDSLLKEYSGPKGAKKINILVVDDEEIVLNFFKRLLQDNLYDITVLKTGKEAISSASSKEFDIAFIDIGLSDISGIELYLKLREIKPDIHLMLITGNPYKAEGVESFGCLYKPFEIDKIFLEIDKIRSLKGFPKA
jgi:DNA-binding NtrC family response regulator